MSARRAPGDLEILDAIPTRVFPKKLATIVREAIESRMDMAVYEDVLMERRAGTQFGDRGPARR